MIFFFSQQTFIEHFYMPDTVDTMKKTSIITLYPMLLIIST